MGVKAKLFMLDDCQALDLPDEFRFEGEEVRISRIGDKVILEPIEIPPPADIEGVREKPASDVPPDGIPDDSPTEPDRRASLEK
jgi:antitoxin VapB